MKPIPLYQRECIFILLQEGESNHSIIFLKQVSHASVLRIKKKERTGYFNVKPRPNRSRILTECHDRNIARFIKPGEYSNAVQVQKKLISNENIIISQIQFDTH